MFRAHQRLEFAPTLTTPEIEERHPACRHRVIVDKPRQSACMSECRSVTVLLLQRSVGAFAGLACLVTLTACGTTSAPAVNARMVERSHVSMGSTVHVSVSTADEAAAVEPIAKVFDEFDRLDALMSVWKEGSDVLRINEAAGRTSVGVTPEVLEVLRASQELSEWTGGKFDVTFGALSGVWRFDHDTDGQIPSRAEIVSRLPLIDYRALHIDERAGTARLTRAGMKVHLGGIGKGYAIDRSVTILRESGLRDFMIQSGGDLFLSGRRGDRPWSVGIQDPRGEPNTSFAAVEIADAAVSTSGDYERFFVRDGHRYHHILDPDTGEPAMRSRSVTIMAKTGTAADGLSTGVFILGAEQGMALIEKLPDVEGVIVTAGNQVLVSTGLKTRLNLLNEPTDAP
jgi:FAD:protein FMN transferase